MKTRSLSLPLLSVFSVLFVSGLPNAHGQSPSGSRVQARQVFHSPDGAWTAEVTPVKQHSSYGINPSRIEIRDRKGHLLSEKDYSMLSDQGLTVNKAAWTKDARFFVFLTEQSGGHSPWRHPAFYYSCKKHRFYSLDDQLTALGSGPCTITGGLELRAPSTVVTTGRYYAKGQGGLHARVDPKNPGGDRLLEIDLKWLEAR